MAKKRSPKTQSRVSCDHCPAMCCRYVATEIDEPTTRKEYDFIRWYLMHANVHVFIDHDDDWYLEFETPCENLGSDNRCMIYEVRPSICREHGDADVECEFHSSMEPHKIRFSTTSEFEGWLDQRGIRWRRKSKS